MDEKQRIAAAKKLHEKARQLRGRFLNHVAVIERRMAVIITEYFCREDEEKRDMFFEKVAERLPLRTKRDILFDIVKHDHPSFWDENKDVLTNLQRIQEFRNKLAHSVLDISDEALSRSLEEGIGFIQWNKGKPVTDAEFDDMVVAANMVIGVLGDIRMLLPYKEKPEA